MPLHTFAHESHVLAGNPLGDPTTRELLVWTPPGVADDQPLPALLGLVGFTGNGRMLFNTDPLQEPLERKLERLVASGACAPFRVVVPDCFTRLGGNQYLNSTATGRYDDYLVDEIVPFGAARFATTRWGVFGKSSGGYGALTLGLRHPDLFAALADHSGDAGFELCYLADFPAALAAWRDAGGPTRWLASFWADDNRRRTRHHNPLNALAMAAHYSPNPASPHLGIDLPFNLMTGEFLPQVWARWLEHDPVHLVPRHLEALRRLRLIYLDCGEQDEFALVWGARTVAAKLRAGGIDPEYREFADGHMNLSYRYDVSLPLLVKALAT